MTKTKLVKKEAKVKWADVKSVAPKTTPKPAVAPSIDAEAVPFGGTSEVEQIIRGYRKYVKSNPIPKNGIAKAPDGTQYRYFLTEDVMDHADAFCESQGGFLQSWMDVVEGNNVMSLSLEHLNSGQVKRVSADLGRPSSMADFGGRITYSPKYLVAMLFGISVQTDTDAYHNGKINDNTNNNATDTPKPGGEVKTTTETETAGLEGLNNSLDSNSGSNSDSAPNNVSVPATSDASVADRVETAAFKAAKSFIAKAYSEVMLGEAETKLANSQKLSDQDKEELAALVSQKRESLKK